MFLFCPKVVRNFLVEMLHNFLFPRVDIGGGLAVGEGLSDTDAERQRMLMLMGKWDKVPVAEHQSIMPLMTINVLPFTK